MKPLRLLWLLPLFMAMDGPSCVMSERPLTRIQRDSIDTSIIGEWMSADDPNHELALWVGVRDGRTMEFRWFESDGSYFVLTGHTSRIGDQTYANLQFVDAGCTSCGDEELDRIRSDFRKDYAAVMPDNPANTCTYMIVRYDLAADGSLRYFLWDPEHALAAIESGQIDGSDGESAGPGEYDDLCITASRRQLRRFVDKHGIGAFAEEDWTLVRRPPAAGRPPEAAND